MTPPKPSAVINVQLCCRQCLGTWIWCPHCGSRHWVMVLPEPSQFPIHLEPHLCDDCGSRLLVRVIGWRPNPTGERPAVDLTDRAVLERLERSLQAPAKRPPSPPAIRPQQLQSRRPAATTASPAAPQRRITTTKRKRGRGRPLQPRPEPWLKPCPEAEPRQRLAVWQQQGMPLPDGITPAGVAASYRRVFGRPARRDPSKRSVRCYSRRELRLAVLALQADRPQPSP